MGQGVVIGCCCNQPIKFFVYILASNALLRSFYALSIIEEKISVVAVATYART